jgi:uncharacterized protein YceK
MLRSGDIMRILALLITVVLVAACTSAIKLQNPTTGATAQCGPYQLEGLGQPGSVAQREARCLDDVQRQGFVRVSD